MYFVVFVTIFISLYISILYYTISLYISHIINLMFIFVLRHHMALIYVNLAKSR